LAVGGIKIDPGSNSIATAHGMAIYGDMAGAVKVNENIEVTATEAKGISVWGGVSGTDEKGIHVDGNITVKGDIDNHVDGISIVGDIIGDVNVTGPIKVTNSIGADGTARGFHAEGNIGDGAAIALGDIEVKTNAWGAGFMVGKVGLGSAIKDNATITVGDITVKGLTDADAPATGYGFRVIGDIVKEVGNPGPKVTLNQIEVTAGEWGCGVGIYVYVLDGSTNVFYSADAGTLVLNGDIQVTVDKMRVAAMRWLTALWQKSSRVLI
jgi:hypothetical protein